MAHLNGTPVTWATLSGNFASILKTAFMGLTINSSLSLSLSLWVHFVLSVSIPQHLLQEHLQLRSVFRYCKKRIVLMCEGVIWSSQTRSQISHGLCFFPELCSIAFLASGSHVHVRFLFSFGLFIDETAKRINFGLEIAGVLWSFFAENSLSDLRIVNFVLVKH